MDVDAAGKTLLVKTKEANAFAENPGRPITRPRGESLPQSVLASLDVAVLERRDDGRFRLAGSAPGWFASVFKSDSVDDAISPAESSAYLEHFLFEAEQVWEKKLDSKWLASGPFTETFESGVELTLEAVALSVNGSAVLLLKYPTSDHTTVTELLQQSRIQSLEYGRLIKEINKRELLLHCIVHDLSAPLAGVKSSLELLQSDGFIHPSGAKLHEIGTNQIVKMQTMIREILHVFEADVGPLIPTVVDPKRAPDVLSIAREVASVLSPLAQESGISLDVRADSLAVDTTVAADQSRLERVVFNLIDNAMRFAPANSTITILVSEDGDAVTTRIRDRGPGVEPIVKSQLFERYSQGTMNAGKAGLGLYFCQITVADWGGTIGYEDVPSGGAEFWFRVPHPRNS